MTRSAPPPIRSERLRSNRLPLPDLQIAVERQAMELRVELGIGASGPLSHERALARIPDCDVRPIKHVKGLPFRDWIHFNTHGLHIGAFAFRNSAGRIQIVFNDAHSPPAVRVNLMEECFHIRLGHPPDKLRLYPSDGRHRTYCEIKEDQAYGCGIAALVPIEGLEAMLARGTHLARIAEYYVVPISVVEERISATRLGALATARAAQLSLLG
jgi:hypothetical protein